tara:strand:+ start:1219 stop:2202 length:984 start_codon:yes stop_codon:yes gene_type:complete
MKINYCVTEMGLVGKMPENNLNMRVLESQIHAWDAEHIPISKLLSEDTVYEGNVVVVLPKGGVDKQIIRWLVENHFDTVKDIKEKFTGEVWFYQDGEAGYWNQHTATLQIWWYNNVSQCDKILCPNEADIKYYKGMFPDIPVSVMRSIMAYVPGESTALMEEKAIISGPLTREYNGLQQIIVAKHFECPIYIPPMGQERMPVDSWTTANSLDVNYLDYTDWKTWMINLRTYKYAVNLPGVTAAASFSLNCAWHGIPCIGDKKADTQSICYPWTSVDYNDIESAVKIAKRLKEDEDFYDECTEYALKAALKHFTNEKFLELVEKDNGN